MVPRRRAPFDPGAVRTMKQAADRDLSVGGRDLRLRDEHRFDNGVVYLRYRVGPGPARAGKPGQSPTGQAITGVRRHI